MEALKLLTYEEWCEQCKRRTDSNLGSDFWIARCVCGAQRSDHTSGHPHLHWRDGRAVEGSTYTDADVACAGFLELHLDVMARQVASELLEIRDGLV